MPSNWLARPTAGRVRFGRCESRVRRALLLGAVLLSVSPVASAEEPQSQDEVRIGLVLDMSGIYADTNGPGSVTAANMAIADFGGRVLGKPVKLLVADHQNKADVASNIAREWFDAEHVDAIMDVVGSAPALAVISQATIRNKIVVLNGAGALRITNEACTPTSINWTWDTYALSRGTARAIVKQGYKSWFFVTADYSFGHDLESGASEVIKATGGEVLGAVRAPINNADFSSFLLQAQASHAQVIGLANAGADTINSIKQAAEFGLASSGQRIAGLLVFITDVHSLGLQAAHGMLITSAFYWDRNDETRAWSQRFYAQHNSMPTMGQAGAYSATMHYLKAVQDAGTTETKAVLAKMRDTPVNDMFAKNGRIRADGRMVHDMYLFEVKSPAESRKPWDYYKLVSVIPADEAFQPLAESKCPLVKGE
jgi:branched-chain amino acid transport system substrate-binding protein